MLRTKFGRLDAFTKTADEARVKTTSGGVVTIVSLLAIVLLTVLEWRDYRAVVLHPELVVDKSRADKMEIHMNVSFARIPCEFLTLDVGDASGEIQIDVLHGVKKVRLNSVEDGGEPIAADKLDLHKEEATHLDPDYCGQCYGAPAPPNAIKENCCTTCEEVRTAYTAVSWAFGNGENIEQCQREHYSENMQHILHEGCRVEGVVRVNKVPGSFHFVPGPSFTRGSLHLHDIANYARADGPHTTEHTFHYLRFGPQLPEAFLKQVSSSVVAGGTSGLSASLLDINPLDQTVQKTSKKMHSFTYFVKAVSTVFLPLHARSSSISEDVPVGAYGIGPNGEVETYQYSATMHQRDLDGGPDQEGKDSHQERTHARGGIPGVFVEYDISPIKVINRQVRPRSFINFIVAVCASIGGTLTVGATIDRILYEGHNRIKKRRV